jgi:subtilisin family serine protease
MQAQRSAVTLLIYCFALLSVSAWAACAWGQVAGLEVYHALEAHPKVRVVIAIRHPTTPPAALTSRRAEIAAMQGKVLSQLSPEEFTLIHRWETLSAMAGEVSRSGLSKLMADPDVRRVDLDVGGSGHLAQSVPLIQADKVHALGFTGRGVTVAVLDSGLATTHPDLSDALLSEQCFCTNADGTGCCPDGSTQQSGPGSAEDDQGHGTNVTGIITSAGRIAPVGVAPDAGIVAVKVIDSQGRFASSAQVISGLNWLLMTQPDVRVVNMSLGTSALFSGACDNATAFTMAFAAAIDTLKSRGVTIFASSGNNESTTQMPAPACVANTVSVGAVYDANVGPRTFLGCTDPTTAADQVTCFTNTNTALDLLAPGAPITSTGLGGGGSTFSGTSQASPHAAGAAAVLLEVQPTLTPDQIETTLKMTGVSVTEAQTGLAFPRVDLLAAVQAVQMVVPTISVTPAVQAFDTVEVGQQSPPQTFTVANLGSTNLVIGTITVTGAEASEFRIQHDSCSGQTVAPSGTCLLEVLFAPISTDAKTATLQIPSNDPETPFLEVLLTGRGVIPSRSSEPSSSIRSRCFLCQQPPQRHLKRSYS